MLLRSVIKKKKKLTYMQVVSAIVGHRVHLLKNY